ncbi:MAG: hypothetical protein MK193_10500 [Lentisphaeria bacterium]|nr:hypothetical protein [Lentisphaeria bacterium]
MNRFQLNITIFCISAIFLLTGCQSARYPEDSQKFVLPYLQKNFIEANKAVAALSEDGGDKDKSLYSLEKGSLFLANEDYQEAILQFNIAEGIFKEKDLRAMISLTDFTESLTSTLSNRGVLPYPAYVNDRLMMNAYKAFSYMGENNPNGGRVELRRAYSLQKEAIEISASLSKEEGEDKRMDEQAADSYKETIENDELWSTIADSTDSNKQDLYGTFVNPYLIFLDAISYLHSDMSGNSLERANKDFEWLAELIPNSQIPKVGKKLVDQFYKGKSEEMVYVIVESGLAPIREAIKVNLPLFFISKFKYVGFSIPKLKDIPATYSSYFVQAGKQKYELELVCDYQAVIHSEYKSQLKAIILDEIKRVIVQSVIQYSLRRQGEEDWRFKLAADLFTLYQVIANQADLRSWRTTPSKIYVCAIPKRKARNLVLKSAFNQVLENVRISKNGSKIWYLRVPNQIAVQSSVLPLN